MGKMKEVFMKVNYPYGDLEREYLFNDILIQEEQYELEKEFNIQNPLLITKIEVANESRIEVGSEQQENHQQVTTDELGF